MDMETFHMFFPVHLFFATFFAFRRLFWQRGLAMATRELDKEGAERQVLRYRFAEQTLPGSLNGAGFRYKKSVL